MGCDCRKCEEVMQRYLDRVLDEREQAEAEHHIAECEWCACRYRFEEKFRTFVRTACSEPIPPDLKNRLVALRQSGRLDL